MPVSDRCAGDLILYSLNEHVDWRVGLKLLKADDERVDTPCHRKVRVAQYARLSLRDEIRIVLSEVDEAGRSIQSGTMREHGVALLLYRARRHNQIAKTTNRRGQRDELGAIQGGDRKVDPLRTLHQAEASQKVRGRTTTPSPPASMSV
jgi:hypothetical protein